MPYYRLCFANRGRAGCFDEFPAADDEAALREAAFHIDSGHGELWCDGRLVATVTGDERGRAPSASAALERLRPRLLRT